jgi:Domain of unknown function (DUF4082)
MTGYFVRTRVTNGPLTASASSVLGGGNGVYAYGTPAFPDNTCNAANYWVDVAFTQPWAHRTDSHTNAPQPDRPRSQGPGGGGKSGGLPSVSLDTA